MSVKRGALLVLTLLSCSCAEKNAPKAVSPTAALPATGNPQVQAASVEPKPEVYPPQVEWLAGDRTPAVEKTLALLARLWAYDHGGRDPKAPRIQFELTDREVNEYLAYRLKVSARPGVAGTTLHFLPDNTIRSFVAIDFETFNAWDTYRIPSLLKMMLRGSRTLEVDARFRSEENRLDFSVTKAYGPSGVPFPINIMEGIVQAIGLAQDELFNTGISMPLPFGLKRVWTGAGTFGGET